MAGEAAKRAVTQVQTRLRAIFGDKIDLSDCNAPPGEARDTFYNTRALAALYVKSEIPTSVGNAAKCVTDGGKDGGIDAVAWSDSTKTLHIVQSKWRNNPNKGIELGDFLKLKSGLENILDLNASYFNSKLVALFKVVEKALAGCGNSVT